MQRERERESGWRAMGFELTAERTKGYNDVNLIHFTKSFDCFDVGLACILLCLRIVLVCPARIRRTYLFAWATMRNESPSRRNWPTKPFEKFPIVDYVPPPPPTNLSYEKDLFFNDLLSNLFIAYFIRDDLPKKYKTHFLDLLMITWVDRYIYIYYDLINALTKKRSYMKVIQFR